MNTHVIKELAARFCEAFYSRRFNGDPDFPISTLTLADAYKIQDEVIRLRQTKGEQIVGYKVGCTSDAIRNQFGLKEPINGRLMSPHVYKGYKTLNRRSYVNCAIEPEFVFRIRRDLDGEILDRDYLVDSIEYVSAGIEVHNFKVWYDPPTSQELIASNGIHASLIVGSDKVPSNQLDFKTEVFKVFREDHLVTEGFASEIMGDPIHSLRWLVSHLSRRGDILRAGQLVIPGSPVKLVEIDNDTTLSIEISKIGTTIAEFVSGKPSN
jgi:2-keto-4-pentenoate hydratase